MTQQKTLPAKFPAWRFTMTSFQEQRIISKAIFDALRRVTKPDLCPVSWEDWKRFAEPVLYDAGVLNMTAPTTTTSNDSTRKDEK